jgi:hypothetical protein
MMYNGAPRYRPYLQPTGGLGQQSRTGASLLISSPRNTIGSQGRIYQFEKKQGRGQQYIDYLISVLGTGPRVQPKSLLNVIS